MATAQAMTPSRLRTEQFGQVQRRRARLNVGETERWLSVLGAGLFGYSHMYGGYAGGQAE